MPSSVSRGDNVPPGCLRRRVASRRDASRRGAVRSGRVGFSSFSLSLTPRPFAHHPPPALAHPLSFIPDAFEFTSVAPEARDLSLSLFLSSWRIDVSSRSDSHYTLENALINVPWPTRKRRGCIFAKEIVPGSYRISTWTDYWLPRRLRDFGME